MTWPFKKQEFPTLEQSRIENRNKVWEEGKRAGLAGAECWENPCEDDLYCQFLSLVWHEGWCRGRQERAANK